MSRRSVQVVRCSLHVVLALLMLGLAPNREDRIDDVRDWQMRSQYKPAAIVPALGIRG